MTGTCPACERPIGTELCCPYCDTDTPSRRPLIALRLAALLTATAGILLLWGLAAHTAAPCLQVAEVTPSMNHAFVRISGTVVGHNTTSFDLDDGTGRFTVMAPQDGSGLPSTGATLEADGSLYLVAGRPARLYVNGTRHLTRLNEETP